MVDAGDDLGRGRRADGGDPGTGPVTHAAGQAPRKPRIEVLRGEPTAASDSGVATPAGRGRIEVLEGAGPRAAGEMPAHLADTEYPGTRRKWWPYLLLAATLFLILVAALSSVVFSPGLDHTISKPKSTKDLAPAESASEVVEPSAPSDPGDTETSPSAPAEAPEPPPARSAPVLRTETVRPSSAPRTVEEPRAERPASEPAPRDPPAVPVLRDAPPPADDTPLDDGDAGPIEDGSALRTAREFYAALSAGDGASAAQYVIPSKRQSGPLSAGALTRYYSNLDRSMRLRRARPVSPDTVRVSYDYVLLDGRLCQGQALVRVIQTSDRPLISSIRAYGPC